MLPRINTNANNNDSNNNSSKGSSIITNTKQLVSHCASENSVNMLRWSSVFQVVIMSELQQSDSNNSNSSSNNISNSDNNNDSSSSCSDNSNNTCQLHTLDQLLYLAQLFAKEKKAKRVYVLKGIKPALLSFVLRVLFSPSSLSLLPPSFCL